jgi:hypothetical protein
VEDKLLPHIVLPSLDNLKTWKFLPEVQQTCAVTFIYRIEGDETSQPENPRVELDWPRIKITVKPFKLTGATSKAQGK